jgi:hypothetical protein
MRPVDAQMERGFPLLARISADELTQGMAAIADHMREISER